MEIPGNPFAPFRDTRLTRKDALEVERFIGLWIDPPPPHSDVKGEHRLLGAALVRPALLPLLIEEIGPEHFADPTSSAIWREIVALAGRGEKVSWETVGQSLGETRALDDVGGPDFLAQLARQMSLSPGDAVLLARRLAAIGAELNGVSLQTPPWEAA